jgi:hypothetical protein
MMLAARHPDLFADAASLSGAVDTGFLPIAEVVSASPALMNQPLDTIYGSQATQEVRWRGHNPTTLASNLRGLTLQVRTADGLPSHRLGESLLGPTAAACVAEAGVHATSLNLHRKLTRLHIPHLWRDYGNGCHTVPNFEREIVDTLRDFTHEFAHPKPAPRSFDYRSVEPSFSVYGWRVRADPKRALEFLDLSHAGRRGLRLTGSGLTTVTTPPWFRGRHRVRLTGATRKRVTPDNAGRITFQVDLGSPDRQQQYTLGAVTKTTTRTVTFAK